MDLRKATCSECKSHLHYMENLSHEQNSKRVVIAMIPGHG